MEINNYTRKSFAYDIMSLVHFDYYTDESKSYYKDEINNNIKWHRDFPIANKFINDNSIDKILLKENFQNKVPFTGHNEPNDIIIENTPKFGHSCPLFSNCSYVSAINEPNAISGLDTSLNINSLKRNEIEFFIKPLNKIHDSLIDISIFNDALIFNGHTYKIFKESLSWDNANKKCKEINGHLATSTTIDEQNFLNSFLEITNNQNNIFWLNGEFIDNKWKWNNDDYFIYKNWSNNYNENNIENNVHKITINKNSWNANNGEELHYYICEWDYNVLYEHTNIENFENPYNYYIYNNHTYKIIPLNVSWDKANEICKNLGGNLASINNQEEQDFINNIIQKPYSYWVGANNYREQWLWINNNDHVIYTNWYENQPDSGKNSCVRILSNYNGKWVDDHSNDISCYFICEWNNNKLLETKPIKYNKNINIANNKNFFFRNKRYQYFNEFLTWDEAFEKCKKLDANLLTITSQEEQEFITEMIKELDQDTDIWLGAYSNDNKNWQWVTNEPWQYTNWYDTEIDLYHLDQRSVLRMIDGNYWIDEDNYYGESGEKHKYICMWNSEKTEIKSSLNNNIIIFNNNDNNNFFIFGIDEDNNYAININKNIHSSNTKPLYNEWQHISIRINNNIISIFLNRNLILNLNINTFTINPTTSLIMGNFNGFIDEFIYKYSINPYAYEYNNIKSPTIPQKQYCSTLFTKTINDINAPNNNITEINKDCSLNLIGTLSSANDNNVVVLDLNTPELYLDDLPKELIVGTELLFIITDKKNNNAPNDNIGKFAFRTIMDNVKRTYYDMLTINNPIIDEFNIHELSQLYKISVLTVPIFDSLLINQDITIHPTFNNIIAFKVKNECIINGNIIVNENNQNNNNILYNNMPDKIALNEGTIFIECNDLTINNTAKIGSNEGNNKNNIMIVSNKIKIDNDFKINNKNYIYLAYKINYNMNNNILCNDVLNYNINNLSLSSYKSNAYDIWRAENLPEGIFINEYTGELYGKCNIPGTYHITIIHESNTIYETIEKTITITKDDLLLYSPYITSETSVKCNLNNIFTYQITGKNLGIDYIFDIENNPEDMIVDHKTGLVTWQIPKNQKNKNIIFTVIINTNDGIAKKNIELTLLTPPSWTPNISNSIEKEDNDGLTTINIPILSTLLYQIHFDDNEINNIDGKYFMESDLSNIQIDEDTGIIIWDITQTDIKNSPHTITFGKRNYESNEIYVYNKIFNLSLESNKLEITYDENEDDLDTNDKIIKLTNKNNGILNYYIKNNSNINDVKYRIENAPEEMHVNSITGEIIWNYNVNDINNEYNITYYIEKGNSENPIILDSYSETIKLVRFNNSKYNNTHAYDWLCINNNERLYTIYSRNTNYCIGHIYYQMPNYYKYNTYYLDDAPDTMYINRDTGCILYHIKANDHTCYQTVKVRINDNHGNSKQKQLIFYIEIEDEKLIDWKVIINDDITIYYQQPMTPYKVDSRNT